MKQRIVIVLAQLHIVLGGSPNSSAWQNLRELPQQIIDHHSHAAVLWARGGSQRHCSPAIRKPDSFGHAAAGPGQA